MTSIADRISSVHPDYVRSAVFGCEDGLVSTTGAMVGIAIGAQDPDVILLAGFVVLAVEALSMAAGQLLSERTVHQLEPTHRDRPWVGAVVMFVAYAVAGLVPLGPLVVQRSASAAFVGAGLAFAALFGLGWVKGRYAHVDRLRSGFEVLAVGGLAAVIGIGVGVLFRV
jgi:VIT1/CCC1 family predicted Fe2+/Mn2+ transporter